MSNPQYKVEQILSEGWEVIFADDNIEYVYHNGNVANIADMPREVYEEIHFND